MPPVDAGRLARLSAGVPGGLRGLIELFVSHTTQTMDELRAALDAGRADEVRRLSHRACGSAGAFGATTFLQRLRALETASKASQPAELAPMVASVHEEFVRVRAFLTTLLEDQDEP